MEFVIWLFRIGRLAPETAMVVLNQYLMYRRPLGRVAVAEGFLSESDVNQILTVQEEEAPRGRFGEVALRLGLLDLDELQDVLAAQQRDVPAVEVLLARVGGIPLAEQAALKSRFRDDMSV